LTENDLLQAVLSLAKLYGWRTFHARPAQTARGWRTAVSGDGKGWPDLFMCRSWQTLAVELKRTGGTPTPEQRLWLDTLRNAGVPTAVWTPANWENGDILATLKPKKGQVQS
jgi:hypothetical protein